SSIVEWASMAGLFTVIGTAQASSRGSPILSISDPAQALRLRWWIPFDPSRYAGQSDRNMRHSSLVTRSLSVIIVALLIVAAAESTARAQLPPDPQGEVSSSQTATHSEEPTPPSFSGPILERSKLTGDWCGCRTSLQDC